MRKMTEKSIKKLLKQVIKNFLSILKSNFSYFHVCNIHCVDFAIKYAKIKRDELKEMKDCYRV